MFEILVRLLEMFKLRDFSLVITLMFVAACSSAPKESEHKELVENKEFDKVVAIKTIPEPTPVSVPEKKGSEKTSKKAGKPSKVTKPSTKNKKKTKGKKKAIPEKNVSKPAKKTENKKAAAPTSDKTMKAKEKKHLPAIEDGEGFDGRRPVVMPYKVGEEIVLGLSYFGVEAGKFTMQVQPMVEVNGKKSYHFRYLIKSSPLFSMFYSVDDVAETFVDFEKLVPYSYEIHVDESKQVRETKTFFDHKNLKAIMWDKKKKPDEPIEKKKVEWDLLPYSQNVFSAAYYLRNFTLKVGKELKVHVGHEGSNILMKAKVVRKEKIYTDVGAFETYVVKPTFDVEGKFKPTGENFLWLTADDRKMIVRLESKIKIGTIVGEVQKIKK